jgi:Ran GTPase-activating protein (RanGAP) involved in mRNA processing and transport
MAQSTSARNKLDAASLAALLDAVQADPSLRSLRLRHVGLTPNLAVQLADFLETNRSITALDLTGNAIGSHGASCIAASLQQNNTIEQLTLDGCGLTSDAVVPFVACFTGRANMALRSIE